MLKSKDDDVIAEGELTVKEILKMLIITMNFVKNKRIRFPKLMIIWGYYKKYDAQYLMISTRNYQNQMMMSR